MEYYKLDKIDKINNSSIESKSGTSCMNRDIIEIVSDLKKEWKELGKKHSEIEKS